MTTIFNIKNMFSPNTVVAFVLKVGDKFVSIKFPSDTGVETFLLSPNEMMAINSIIGDAGMHDVSGSLLRVTIDGNSMIDTVSHVSKVGTVEFRSRISVPYTLEQSTYMASLKPSLATYQVIKKDEAPEVFAELMDLKVGADVYIITFLLDKPMRKERTAADTTSIVAKVEPAKSKNVPETKVSTMKKRVSKKSEDVKKSENEESFHARSEALGMVMDSPPKPKRKPAQKPNPVSNPSKNINLPKDASKEEKSESLESNNNNNNNDDGNKNLFEDSDQAIKRLMKEAEAQQVDAAANIVKDVEQSTPNEREKQQSPKTGLGKAETPKRRGTPKGQKGRPAVGPAPIKESLGMA